MKRRSKILAVLAALLPIVGVAGLFSARSICACGDAEIFWGGKLRMSPVTGDPQKVRAAILERLPRGSPVEDVNRFIWETSQAGSIDRRCQQGEREIACHFPVMEEWFGLKKRGFFASFTLDEKRRLADAGVRGYIVWFEEPR